MPESESYLLHSECALLDAASRAVDHGRSIGVPALSALATESAGTTITVRAGAPASLIRDGGHALAVTVLDDGRSGRATTEAIDDDAIRRAVEKAWAIARVVQPEPGAGLPDRAWLADDGAEPALFAPSARAPRDLTAIALDIERTALARPCPADATIRVDAAVAASSDMRWALATSDGFARAASASMQTRVCAVLAERGDDRTSDWWQDVARREDDLSSSASLAGEAVGRTVAKFGARAVSTRSAPVLFDPRIAAAFVAECVGALNGEALHQRSTFLADAMGSERFARHVDLVEDPAEPFGMATSAWDSEGVAPRRRHIVRGGIVEGYFLGTRSARKLGMRSTGNADGPNNLTLSSRTAAPADDVATLCGTMGRGLWVTRLLGGQVNLATGSYSKAIEGFWIEDGAVAHPVSDMTIAGDLSAMLAGIVAIGSDRYRRNAARSGAILFDDMRIAGR